MKSFTRIAAFLLALSITFHTLADEKKILYWYDPMVPDKHFDKPGKSPFMDMELVPKYASVEVNNTADTSPAVIVSRTMQQQLGIRSAAAQREEMSIVVRASGQLTLDETRMADVAVRADAYIEQLLVRAVGEHVERGQKIASIYAPALQVAQAEYLLAMNHGSGANRTDSVFPEAKIRLLKLGMAEQDIAELTRTRQVLPRVGIYAPIDGLVMMLAAREGGSVNNSETLMQIANHATLWQIINVPERYAQQIHVGQTAEIKLDSNSATVIHGNVQYIYPELDTATRSLRVRIALDNPDGKLLPGMYGQTTLQTSPRSVLSIPTEAVIATGTRNVVIVQDGNKFRPATVITGLEQDGKTEIISGLNEGELVVVSGQFLIDSEATLSGVLARMETSDKNSREVRP
ncbi:MAG: efflux RND transporter periplasmic adaptor subunit [Cellvibrionales bacterium]|nr:efflux RND transporter periplasmic adaptor subunit [Cellvibrionales bacterium]